MEIIIKKEKLEMIKMFADFAETLSEEEGRDFEIFIRGYKLARGSEVKKSA